MRRFRFLPPLATLLALVAHAADTGVLVDKSKYANRLMLPDFTGTDCPENPRDLVQIKGNLYRHTTGAGLAVHSGLVLITKEGALVIDPAPKAHHEYPTGERDRPGELACRAKLASSVCNTP